MCAHFNPRSPHGERRSAGFERRAVGSISIHAPRTGSDTSPEKADEYAKNFNPRSPHGERRMLHWLVFNAAQISIHAPRTGSDCQGVVRAAK